MTQQNLNFGTGAPNDGETLFNAFTKIQANFTELYSGGTGANIPSIKQFGAVCDGVTDDLAAFNAAATYFKAGGGDQPGGRVYVPGICAISNTLNLSSLGLTIVGGGWGNSKNSTSHSALKWIGPAGVSMVKFTQTTGAGLENIRLIGNSSSRPSAAIEFADLGATDLLYGNHLTNVWIGALSGYDTDIGTQFTDGILASGTQNGDSNTFNHVRIYGVANAGVNIQNQNFSVSNFNGLFVTFAAYGVLVSGAQITGQNWFFGNISNSAIYQYGAADIAVSGLTAEFCARLAKCDPSASLHKLSIHGGSFQCNANAVAGDGIIVDQNGSDQWIVVLDDGFHITIAGDYVGVLPVKLKFGRTSASSTGSVRIVGTRGINPSNLTLPTSQGPNDLNFRLVFDPAPDLATDLQPRMDQHLSWTLSEDRTFQTFREDFQGKVNVYGGPLNVRQLADAGTGVVWSAQAVSGTGATTYSYKLTFLTRDGETKGPTASTCTNAASLDSTHKNSVTWYWPQGAYAVKIYGRVGGSEGLLKTFDWSTDGHNGVGGVSAIWIDDGSVSPGASPPTVNTTGNITVEGSVNPSLKTPFATLSQGIITTAVPNLSGSVTWNAGGVAFTGWLLNVTNSASNAGSLLMDLQVAGSSQFNVRVDGKITTVSGIQATSFTSFSGFANLTLQTDSSPYIQMGAGNDLTLSRRAANTWLFGSTVDVASPAAQTFTVQNVVGGTTNGNAVDTTWTGSLSTGSGTSGDFVFKTGGTGAGATSQNAATEALRIKGATQQVIFAGKPRINVAPLSVGTGSKTISNSADSSTNFGHYITINMNGTDYFIPASSVAPT